MKTTGTPRIEAVKPSAALPGGEVSIKGSGFGSRNHTRPQVQFGLAEGSLVMAAENHLIARVPEGAAGGAVRVRMGSIESAPFPMALGVQVADNLHPVASPAVDAEGNVYVTFSGQRGQKVPVSLYKITSSNTVKPFITEMMNPTGLAIDRNGYLFVSCRNDGTVHRVSPDGRAMQWIEGMGIATGLAFDKGGSLYVGDRSGTIFKIAPDREIFVFATSSLRSRLIIWHSALPANFSSAGRLLPVSTPSIALIPAEKSAHFFAVSDARRVLRSIASAISMSLRRLAAVAVSFESLRKPKPNLWSVEAASSAWRFCPRIAP